MNPVVSLGDFVSEPIEPVAGTFDSSAMSRGEPGVPARFRWRGGELYLRRHWFDLQTTCGRRITLYCERQTKNRNKPKQRWWMYAISDAASLQSPDP